MADPELLAHREWLGYVQPVGVVVSPPALLAAQAYVNRNTAPLQQLLLDTVEYTPDGVSIAHLPKLLTHVLRWDDADLVDAPATLECVLPEYNEVLEASYAVRDAEPADPGSPWLMLVKELPQNTDFDSPIANDDRGWHASPEAKFERLLREAQIPIGLLSNRTSLRLVYAPRGETSGYLTFPVAAMTEVAGRPLLAALEMLLCAERLFSLPTLQRLPAILADSRRYQNDVSTRLAGQVLAGLYELLRGFQAADDSARGALLRDVLRENPDLIYEGLLTVLLRLVFLLYAEDRDLMPADEVYSLHYSVGGLFERLRADAGRHTDTMDLRYGAWTQLLSLFRLVFEGVHYGDLRLPARQGHLFDPDRFPFLEGRPDGVLRVIGDRIDAPLISDGVVWRVLQNLVVLDGERLSYRSLDVEQIGSVYETMMGFRLEISGGQSLALKPAKAHGAPITINVEELISTPTPKRAQWIRERADQKLTEKEATAVASASTVADVETALERKIDRRATPNVVVAGSMILQPNEERRRSGSFYTPRSLTEPIVRITLRPVLARLGNNPSPEAILNLKICDPAMGSGAFLVETCRQLADNLVDAWHAHDHVPAIPPDSDELLHARRLVAHQCLYGVDRNPIAVDLAKLSLWLATLARDHTFTFLDHALRCGDSLVGLTTDQIVSFHWAPGRDKDYVTRSLLRSKIRKAEEHRGQIHNAGADTDIATLRHLLREADETVDDIRLAGDLVILAFFESPKPKERETRRDQLAQQVWAWQAGGDAMPLRGLVAEMRDDRHTIPFHWQIEFPEVFDRDPSGFDVVIGNPPFLGGTRIGGHLGLAYHDYLVATYAPATGLADLVAFFFRRAFDLTRDHGTVGLIATNTISQGDTRSAGLEYILEHGGCIYQTRRRYAWPGSVSVVVSLVHIQRGVRAGPVLLDDVPVDRVSAYLLRGHRDHSPSLLEENRGICYRGTKVWGSGFVFEPSPANGSSSLDDMRRLIEEDPRNGEVIVSYLGGEDFNSSPTQSPSRFVIDFGSRSREEAQRWPSLFSIVEERVLPVRVNNKQRNYREQWWLHANRVEQAGPYLAEHGRLLALTCVSQYLTLAFVPRGTIIQDRMMLFLLHQDGDFAVLQSRVHEVWVKLVATSLGDAMSYTTQCFDTFPRPAVGRRDFEKISALYYQHRAELMLKRNEGLTRTYNRFHDPSEQSDDISHLRELHEAMDRVVLDAYGWNDLPIETQFLLDYESEGDGTKAKKPWRFRWTDDVRDEVLARLLALNAERAEVERLKPGGRPKARKHKPNSLPLLFEEQ